MTFRSIYKHHNAILNSEKLDVMSCIAISSEHMIKALGAPYLKYASAHSRKMVLIKDVLRT